MAKLLIAEVAFMAVTLADLKAAISKAGCVEEYQNGKNQSGTKPTSEIQSYNSTVKNFANCCVKLEAMLPETGIGSKLAALMADD